MKIQDMYKQWIPCRPFFYLPRAKRAACLPAREKRGTGDEVNLKPTIINRVKINFSDFGIFLIILKVSFCGHGSTFQINSNAILIFGLAPVPHHSSA